MHAIILAAGVGQRLRQERVAPKCLLEFGGRSLLARHCAQLGALAVSNLTLCLGFSAAQVEDALNNCGGPASLVHYNPLFTLGSSVSLWSVRHTLRCGDDVLLMDADVLYHPEILRRLVASRQPNCVLLDRDFIPGDEPVKLCLRDGRIVEFRKQLAPGLKYTTIGESVGFFKFDADTAGRLASVVDGYVANGARELPYEEAIRDLMLCADIDFGVEDITGLPWIEIDFPDDIARAESAILPRLDERP